MSGVDPVTGIRGADLDRHITEGPAVASAPSGDLLDYDVECALCGVFMEDARRLAGEHLCGACAKAAADA